MLAGNVQASLLSSANNTAYNDTFMSVAATVLSHDAASQCSKQILQVAS
jgi:hypothetical protein